MNDGTLYTRHEIIDGNGYQRPAAHPISMSETLTLWDQFAMSALQGLLANGWVDSRACIRAYELSNAMLAEREKKT